MSTGSTSNRTLLEFFRCPEDAVEFRVDGELLGDPGYFRFGLAICFGRSVTGKQNGMPTGVLYDALQDTRMQGGAVHLPFDPDQVVENLRRENYAAKAPRKFLSDVYYLVRPILPALVRRQIQRFYLRNWDQIAFPRWPVDHTVEDLMGNLLAAAIGARGKEIPFIWFWPNGASAGLILTHDVETAKGLDYCCKLIDLDSSFGFQASFQIVPEQRYVIPPRLVSEIRSRGFEVNIHDLNHDGRLFHDREEFRRRAARLNEHGKKLQSVGFRSGAMYRKVDWFDDLEFEYDMSVPCASHLEPQQGGCCTVTPYFLGRILELPLTTIQDYALFHYLGDYSIKVWKRQIDLIADKHGLVSLIVHPDYIRKEPARQAYISLLTYLSELRSRRKIWMALPGEVNRWWRQRSQMHLVRHGDAWRIEGDGHERACVAYALLEGGRVVYKVPGADH